MSAKSTTIALFVAVCGQGAFASSGGQLPIAGTQPYQRPQGAPVILEVHRDPSWFTHALTGVSEPYPNSLRFLEDQGNWHTPFNHPGMYAPYDIRGWHRQ